MDMNNISPQSKRIRELRIELQLSQEDFAERLKLKRNTISLIENGKRNASNRTLKDICDAWSVSYDWLANGIGNMFCAKDTDKEFAQLIGKLSKTENELERELILKMFKLNKKYLALFNNMLDSLLEIEE
ncbi:TPA: helix-turn-helix domain-containing protein [Clostridioides difficile]|uniref:Putative Helix-turn-helix domain protein n=2 Tax=root TaxID=1 RepID=A0A0A8WF84_9CAUD|nr:MULTISPECIES: helix-turn-helix domain-containing protein [Bacillota]YP_009202028.1 transcriptional regulator [Clostridium phage phiCD506]EGT3685829.1 XRE family transcriptional regulator [Clostridioides difficile]EGT3722832.1 XRE family transcriptional regulator [Clostridioides difficile]EGT3745780.1 XRE family transcriptional regulator [Clostridioides difficile]EGT4713704.1 XRE family transcriptional regulator [Clostridioides difficile]EGT4925026.1 XRE family transcriptional regulator [Cl